MAVTKKVKTVYVADDGTEFEEEIWAERHNAIRGLSDLITGIGTPTDLNPSAFIDFCVSHAIELNVYISVLAGTEYTLQLKPHEQF